MGLRQMNEIIKEVLVMTLLLVVIRSKTRQQSREHFFNMDVNWFEINTNKNVFNNFVRSHTFNSGTIRGKYRRLQTSGQGGVRFRQNSFQDPKPFETILRELSS